MPTQPTITDPPSPAVVPPPKGNDERVRARAVAVVIDWWHVSRRRTITEERIRREMGRLRGGR